jgi:hypothetical protein
MKFLCRPGELNGLSEVKQCVGAHQRGAAVPWLVQSPQINQTLGRRVLSTCSKLLPVLGRL